MHQLRRFFHAHAPPIRHTRLHEGGETRQRCPRPRHVVHDDLRAVEADHSARGILQRNFHTSDLNIILDQTSKGSSTKT